MFRPCCAWQKTSVVLPYRSTEKIRLWKLWNHNNTTLHGQRKHRVHLPFQKKASQFAIFGEFLCCPQLLPLVMYMIKINPRFVSPYTHWHTRRPHAVLTSRIKQNRRSPESVWTEPGGEGGGGRKIGRSDWPVLCDPGNNFYGAADMTQFFREIRTAAQKCDSE